MLIRDAVKAKNTVGIIQDPNGAQVKIHVDYLAVGVDDAGKETVVPLRLQNLEEIEGYIRFAVLDDSGAEISEKEIKKRFSSDA